MAFPKTGILDDFNRADEGPPPSADWNYVSTGLLVSSNQCVPEFFVIYAGQSYWDHIFTFDTVIESYVQITALPTSGYSGLEHVRLIILYDFGSAGYTLQWYASDPDAFLINPTSVGSDENEVTRTLSSPLSNGDWIGFTYNGSAIQAYVKYGSGAWETVGAPIASTIQYASGYNQLGIFGNGAVDNFGGGDTPATVPVSPLIIDSDFSSEGSGSIGIQVTGTAQIYQSRASGAGYDLQIDAASEARVDRIALLNSTKNIIGTLSSYGFDNDIRLLDSAAALVRIYPSSQAGLIAALAAATSGDIVACSSQISIACTSGLTVPASVTLKGANLSFSGFSGTAITLSAGSALFDSYLNYTGTGATARGVLASGVRCSIVNTSAFVHDSTTNIGYELSGQDSDNPVTTTDIYASAYNGTTAVGMRIGDFCFSKTSYADAHGATNNSGVRFFATSLANCGWFLDGWGYSTTAGSYGMEIEAGAWGKIIGGFAVGVAAGLIIGTGATALVYGLQWSSLVNNGTITYLPGDRGTSTTMEWFNVEDYGADQAASAAANTTAINAAITAIPASGGVLYFPHAYNTTGGFTLAKPITVLGDGSSLVNTPTTTAPISGVYSNSATNSLFTVTAAGCSFRNIALVNNAVGTPSAGAGITVTTDLEGTHYDNILIWGFYDDLYINDGALWDIKGSIFYYPVRYGLYAAHANSTDYGDWSIVNSEFLSYQRNPTAAIHIASGGGGKIVNVKINGAGPDYGFTNGIEASIGSLATSILLVSNNSIENFHGDGIHITTSGTTPRYDLINIVGNQFGSYLTNSGGNAIEITAANLGEINQVVIDANQFRAGTGATAMGYAISLTKINDVFIGTYTMSANWTDLLTQTGCTNVKQIGLGSGTVTSVTAGTGIALTPDPIVATGTIALNAALNDLSDVDTSGEATGDIIYDNAGTWIPYPLGVGTNFVVTSGKLRIGSATNYLEIDKTTGNLRLVGDATAWDDMRIAADVVHPGATAPNWKAFGPSGNIQALMFEASHHDEAMFGVQLSHAWKEGSRIYPHVHWAPTDATAGNVVWELEYTWANIDGTFGAPGNMATDATAAGGVAWVHKLTQFKESGNNYIDATGKTLSSMLMCRVHRNSNAGSDTLNKDVALLEVDFHFEIDSFGSDTADVKDASSAMFLESGDYLLLENGDNLLLE